MVVRKASEKEAVLIAAIGQCVWVDTYATEGMRETIANYVLNEFTEENILKLIQSKDVFVLEAEKHLIGYTVVSTSATAEIETLYILPTFQGHGFGKELLNYALQHHHSVRLSCWERNTRAIEFYKRHGFTESGETYFEMEGERHRNVILTYHT